MEVTKTTQERLFSRDFLCVLVAQFANTLGVQTLLATLPVYVVSLGGSRAEAGLVSGTLYFTALLFRPWTGWLTDAWRRRPLVLIGSSLYGVSSLVYLLTHSIPLLVFGRFVQGLGMSCYSTAAHTYVADIAPRQRRAEAMGFFAAVQAIALILGPVLGFMLVNEIGFHYLFYCTAGLGFSTFVISLFAKERRLPSEVNHRPWTWKTGIVAVSALPISLTMLFLGVGLGAISTFIAIFAQSRGLSNPGFYFMVQAGALLISRPLAGRLADRYGRLIIIIPGVIFMTLALALLPLAQGFPHFVVSAALYGMGLGSAQPAIMALLVDRTRKDERGLATSTYFTGYDLGIAIGAMGLGIVSQHLGFGAMWGIAAACTGLSLLGILLSRHSGNAAAQ
ncbi:MAG: MFS transporter [Deltaproteobacteria bacterium]|nr:MFS transporter [Deltaproteobacteria bacterium]